MSVSSTKLNFPVFGWSRSQSVSFCLSETRRMIRWSQYWRPLSTTDCTYSYWLDSLRILPSA